MGILQRSPSILALDHANPVSDDPLNDGLISRYLTLPTIGGGLTLHDITDMSNGRHCTLTDMDPDTDWEGPRGRPGGFAVLNFDGTDDKAVRGEIGVSGNVEFTISGWFYFLADGANGVMGWGNQDAARQAVGFYYDLRGTNNVLSVEFSGNSPAFVDTAIAQNEWHHVVFTKTPGAINTTSTFYLDGIDMGALDGGSSTGTPDVKDENFAIGKWVNQTTDNTFINALIDNIKVWNRALSAAEALDLYLDDVQGSPRTLRYMKTPVDLTVAAFVPYPNPRYSMSGGHQPLSGGIGC